MTLDNCGAEARLKARLSHVELRSHTMVAVAHSRYGRRLARRTPRGCTKSIFHDGEEQLLARAAVSRALPCAALRGRVGVGGRETL